MIKFQQSQAVTSHFESFCSIMHLLISGLLWNKGPKQPSDLHRSSNWNHQMAYVGTHKPPILSIAALDTKTHTLCSRSSRLIVGLNGQLKSLCVCVQINQKDASHFNKE